MAQEGPARHEFEIRNPLQQQGLQAAADLMRRFAERTGLASQRPQQRYLWTDAFAVGNFLSLARATADDGYLRLALALVDRVHQVLGRHRSDDSRVGWLSGLAEETGAMHPTRGGLRIGKRLPERRADEPFDAQLEWDRDGQYFHYLTRWMHALDQVARATGQARFNLWARELADSAYRGFQQASARVGPPRLAWKMSIDLSRPLITSMGQHDPLDGLISCVELRQTALLLGGEFAGPDLDQAVAGFSQMVKGGDWITADPLGVGGLLIDAARLYQLVVHAGLPYQQLLQTLLRAALASVQHHLNRDEFEQPASRRLAFRELGLAIGLQRVALAQAESRMEAGGASSPQVRNQLAALAAQAPLGLTIRRFWLEPEHRNNPTWITHLDINDVMLATSLLSEFGPVYRSSHSTNEI